jgi:hypothetical protein
MKIIKKSFHLKGISLLTMIVFFCTINASSSLYAQTRNMYVEGDGDQMSVIRSLANGAGAVGSAGLELVRGDQLTSTDWRVINDNGVLRIQSEINNFQSNGQNKFTILENGFTGIGCSNPQAKLSICSGQLAFSNGLSESHADKISLDGYSFDQPDMVGLGYETTVIAGPGGTEEISDLYFKAEGSHRWYTNANADGGTSASMVLDRDGELGVGLTDPQRYVDVRDEIRITGISENPTLEFYDESQSRIESQIKDFPLILSIAGLYKDINFAASNSGALQNRMRIQGSNGYVGIATESPDTRLHVVSGTDVSLTGGGYVQLGDSDAENIGIDNNEIMARNDGAAATLYIQKDQGNVLLCNTEMGQVGIGISDPANLPDPSYLLAVDGKILAEEVRIELSGAWPDYVFTPEYNLLEIDELHRSIQKNGHLPGIPSAKQLEAEGMEIGDMQKRMMEKIEELTLYIIQINDENKVLESRLKKLENSIRGN